MTRRQRNMALRNRPGDCLEVLVVIGVLLVVNLRFFSETMAYEGWVVNPYLATVVVAAVRYGTAVGLWAALSATVAFLLSVGHRVGDSAALAMFPGGHALPVWLVAAALVCGPATDRMSAWLGELILAHDATTEKLDTLSQEYTLLADEKHLLDKQVLSEEDTFETLITLFGELDERPMRELPAHVTWLTARVLGGGQAALYQCPREDREPQSAVNTAVLVQGDGDWPAVLPTRHPMMDRALSSPNAVSLPQLAGWMTVNAVREQPIHVACAVGGVLARRQLLVVARNVPLTGFSRARLRALTLAMAVVGKTLKRSRAVQRLRVGATLSAALRRQGRRIFRSQVRRAVRKARAAGHQVHVLSVRVARREDRVMTDRIAKSVTRSLRDSGRRLRPFVYAADAGHVLAVCSTGGQGGSAGLVEQVQGRLLGDLWPGTTDSSRPKIRVASLRVDSDDMMFRDPGPLRRKREVLVLHDPKLARANVAGRGPVDL